MSRADRLDKRRIGTRRGGIAARTALAGSLLLGTAALALPSGWVGAQVDGEAPTTAQAAPEETALFLAFDTDLESNQWQQVEALLSRLGVPDVSDEFDTALDDLEEESMEDAPSADQVRALLGGELAVAVTTEALTNLLEFTLEQSAAMQADPTAMASDEAPFDEADVAELYDAGGLAAILEPGDMDVAWAYVEEQFETLAEQTGSQVEQSEDGDVEILEVAAVASATPAADDDPDEADEEAEEAAVGVAAARAGDLIIAAASADSLQPFVDAASGTTTSLAESDGMATVLAELPTSEGFLFAYSDSSGIREGLDEDTVAAIESLSPAMAEAGDAAWNALTGFVGYAADEGFRFDTIQIGGDGGDLSALGAPNAEITTDQNVADNSVVYFAGYQPEGTYDTIAYSIATAIAAGAAAMSGEMGTPIAVATPASVEDVFSEDFIESQFAAAEQVLGFDLRDDFLGLFGGEYAFAVGLPAFNAAGLDLGAIFTSEVEDADTVADSSQRLARLIESMAGGDVDVSARQVEGDSLYVVRDPSTQGVPALEFGVVGERFFAGVGTAIETFVGGADSPLADNEQYQRVLATLPDERYQVGYVDLKQIVGLVTAFTGAGAATFTDADPACGDYVDQAEAQAAYDEDPITNSDLDQDFDNEACEDFYGAATPEASPAVAGALENLEAFAAVAFERDGALGSSAIIYIADE